MGVNERNAAALLEKITLVEKNHEERLRAMEILMRGLVNQVTELNHRYTVLIGTMASTGPTEKDNGSHH